ncbi:Hypothetical protein, putative, partial [Bodo saltans]
MEQLLRSMQHVNIMKAVAIGESELADQDVFNTVDLLKDIRAQCPNSLKGLSNFRTELFWKYECVAFFGCAGNDLFVAIPTPHSVPTMDVGVKEEQTLHLFSKLPLAYKVYSFTGGVDKVKKKKFNLITTFVVEALTSHQKQSAPLTSPHDVLKLPEYFTYPPLNVRHCIDNFLCCKRFVATTEDDWKVLSTRYVDCCHFGGRRLDDDSILFDLQLPHTWAGDANNTIVLIDGESGSGKTMEMLCGHFDKSNLVVYMRCFHQVCTEIIGSDTEEYFVIFNGCNSTLSDDEIREARMKRNAAFLELAAQLVQSAVKASCPAIVELLKNHNNTGKVFTVRLC